MSKERGVNKAYSIYPATYTVPLPTATTTVLVFMLVTRPSWLLIPDAAPRTVAIAGHKVPPKLLLVGIGVGSAAAVAVAVSVLPSPSAETETTTTLVRTCTPVTVTAGRSVVVKGIVSSIVMD
jgi:hypothetical protein